MIRLALLTAVATALVSSRSHAHPGHGNTEPTTALHYLTDPAHVMWLLGPVVMAALYWAARRRART